MFRVGFNLVLMMMFSPALDAALLDDKNVVIDKNEDMLIGSDYIIRKSQTQHHGVRTLPAHASRRNLLSVGGLLTGRANFWDNAWPAFDSMKTKSNLWTPDYSGRPVLDGNHIVVLPVWWDGEAQTSFDISTINSMMQQTKNYYLDISWMKHNITWDILNGTVLTGVTRDNAGLDNAKLAAKDYVNQTLKLVEFVDYTSLTIVYNKPNNGSLNMDGGWGSINGTYRL
jgi:hypothetical protein